MNTFTDKNKYFLYLCSNIARFFGLLLLFSTLIAIAIPLSGIFWADLPTKYFTKFLESRFLMYIFKTIFLALFLLGIEQFIKYLVEIDFKPNWILRNSHRLVYLYVILLFITHIYSFVYTKNMIEVSNQNISYWVTVIPMGIFAIVKILLWIAFGIALKKILPIIQESKTLV